MTVAELIDALRFFEPTLPVFCREYNGWYEAPKEADTVRLTDPRDWERTEQHCCNLGVIIR